MLMCELHNPVILKNLFKGFYSMFDDVQIKCNDKGINLEVLNRSKTVLTILNIGKNFFNMYSCEKEIILNLDIEELFKSLESMYDDDRLIIKTHKGQLEVIFEGIAKRTFKLKLEDKNYEPIKMPNIEDHRGKCELPFKLLNDAIIDADKLRQTVKLSLDSNYFKLNSKGGFLNMNVDYLHGEKVEGKYSSSFSTGHILNCLKSNISDIVGLKIGKDAPLSIFFNSKHLSLEFMIAPRLE